MYNEVVYKNILKSELIEATGCTEPIALAYASSFVNEYIKDDLVSIDVFCSGNIIKNVNSVTVPNSNGKKGIKAAIALGIVGGKSEEKLQVISQITSNDIVAMNELLAKNIIVVHFVEECPPLYIKVCAKSNNEFVEVVIQGNHTNITKLLHNDVLIIDKEYDEEKYQCKDNKDQLNIEDIVKFSVEANIDDIKDILKMQIDDNLAIAKEGLINKYGTGLGSLLLDGDDIYKKIKAYCAAASEARMNGCKMPVVINSGSGNQGITITIPVVLYGKYLNVADETLYRALIMANLLSVHQKKYIGSLSAYCGATSASAAAVAAICWMCKGNIEQISATITNSQAMVAGMMCDGAKSSCAGKIVCGLESAFVAMKMALNNSNYLKNDGIIKSNPEETIKNIGHLARDGMKELDKTILNSLITE